MHRYVEITESGLPSQMFTSLTWFRLDLAEQGSVDNELFIPRLALVQRIIICLSGKLQPHACFLDWDSIFRTRNTRFDDKSWCSYDLKGAKVNN